MRDRRVAEAMVEISWRHDVDQVLAEARRTARPVLLDFNATPM